MFGIVLLGISIGYTLGFYAHKVFLNSYWFYFSVPIFIFASGFILYGSLYLKDDN